MIADHKNRLWISTRSSIYRFIPETNEWITFGRKYDIKAHDINRWDLFVTRTGKLLVSSSDGFLTIDPEGLNFNHTKPYLRITDFILNNKVIKPAAQGYLHQPIEQTEILELPYNQNNFGFNFALLDYTDPDRNLFYTRLLNYDSTWRNAGSERSATYINVPPGDYVFEIKAANSSGIQGFR